MSYAISERHQAIVLSIQDRLLGSIDGEGILEAVSPYESRGATNLVVDLSKTTFMDSSGIGVLIQLRERMQAAGGDVRLAGMQQRIRGLFIMTKLLGSAFTNYETVDDAATSFAQA